MGLTEILEQLCGRCQVRRVHVLPMLEHCRVVPQRQLEARQQLGLGRSGELLRSVQALGESAEQIGEDLVRAATVADGQILTRDSLAF